MAKKIKGKDWYTVVAPKVFDGKVLGETPVDDTKKLRWRKISAPLINLTNDMNKYYFKIDFRITDVNGKTANTEFAGLECLRDYISRMVRHGVTRIDTSQNLSAKDGKKIIVKTITVTHGRVKKGLEKELSAYIKDAVEKTVSASSVDELLQKIIDDSLKKKVIKEGSKIYPVRNFEIRKIEVPVK